MTIIYIINNGLYIEMDYEETHMEQYIAIHSNIYQYIYIDIYAD